MAGLVSPSVMIANAFFGLVPKANCFSAAGIASYNAVIPVDGPRSTAASSLATLLVNDVPEGNPKETCWLKIDHEYLVLRLLDARKSFAASITSLRFGPMLPLLSSKSPEAPLSPFPPR
jgi:hypothetical protein